MTCKPGMVGLSMKKQLYSIHNAVNWPRRVGVWSFRSQCAREQTVCTVGTELRKINQNNYEENAYYAYGSGRCGCC